MPWKQFRLVLLLALVCSINGYFVGYSSGYDKGVDSVKIKNTKE